MSHSTDVILSAHRIASTLPDGRTLFTGLTLGLGRERTGLVGRNGIGKSTLARILAGAQEASEGTVVRSGRVGYLPQARGEPGADGRPAERDGSGAGGPTVADALGVGEALRALDRILRGSTDPADYDAVGDDWDLPERVAVGLEELGLGDLPLERPLAGVSGGEATRIALARRVLERPDYLILDEPTNDLDVEAREALYRFVESWAHGLLVITHDRALLERVDGIVELTTLGARHYGGGYALFEAQRATQREAAERALEHERRALKEAKRAAQRARERQERRTAAANRGRATANMPKILLNAQRERGEGTVRRLGEVAGRRIAERERRVAEARGRVEAERGMELDLAPTGLHSTRLVAELAGVGFTFPGSDRPVLDDVTLRILGPERIAVTGPNGSGKTTLLRLLTGRLEPTAGRVRLALPRGEVAYLDQRAAILRPDLSILESYRRLNPEADPQRCHHALARFLFRGDASLTRVGRLSGGERLRAALACTVGSARPPKLLILDEPTNHLDLDSLRAVEDVLGRYDGALVVVSHDAAFLDAVGVEREVSTAG